MPSTGPCGDSSNVVDDQKYDSVTVMSKTGSMAGPRCDVLNASGALE